MAAFSKKQSTDLRHEKTKNKNPRFLYYGFRHFFRENQSTLAAGDIFFSGKGTIFSIKQKTQERQFPSHLSSKNPE